MKKRKYRTLKGNIAEAYLPENDVDLAELNRLDALGMLDTRSALADYNDENWDNVKEKPSASKENKKGPG